MTQNRFFSLSGAVLLLTGLFVACGDGEPNDPGGTGGGGGDVDCNLVCDGTCVDSNNDPANCGACGETCGAGEICVEGACGEANCREGQVVCDNACVTTDTDRNHCGACGTACAASEICDGGECVAADCREGQVLCGSACTTLATDRANCGACGTACGTAELCVAGTCELSCTNGLIACGNSCVNPLADPGYCGATECTDGAGGASNGVECGEREACVIGECREFVPIWNQGAALNGEGTVVGTEQSVAMDASGNAVLIWRQQTGADAATQRVFASYYEASTKQWSPALRIDDDTVRVRNLKVAMAANGDAVAVWIAGPTTGSSEVKAARFSWATKMWSDPARLDNLATVADTPDVAVSADGDGLVAWSQVGTGDPALARVFVSRLVAGEFSAPEAVALVGAQPAEAWFPKVAVNHAGAQVVVWQQYENSDFVWLPLVSRYSGGWTTPVDLRTAGAVTEFGWGTVPDVGIDDAGNITVAFAEDVFETDVSIVASRFDATLETWTSGVAEDVTEPVTDPRIAVERDGNATIVFQEAAYKTDGSGELENFSRIHASRFETGTWLGAQLLSTTGAPTVRVAPKVRSADAGNVFAFWVSGTDVIATRFDSSTSAWTHPETLNEGLPGGGSPDLAASTLGTAFGTWISGSTLYVARFD